MWYLATNEIDVFYYGELFEGAQITTGQPILLYFETIVELESKLQEYEQEYIKPEIMDLPPEPSEN